MATLPAASYLSNAGRTEGEYKQAHEDHLAGTKQIPGAGVAELTATIATGSITPAGSGGVVVVDTEAAAATDDLTNIATTNYPDGSFLLIRNSNAARFVVVKHLAGGAGQMNLDLNGEYTLDDTKKWLLLQRRSADWYEVFRGPQRAPADVNPIINGSMEVWQRGTTFAGLSTNAYTADRWLLHMSSAAVVTVNRSTTIPTVAQAGVLFNYSLEVDITTADATIAASDWAAISQTIEGVNWRHFAQRQFTFSFWVQSPKTGTHCVTFRNNAQATPDRSYVATYTVVAANTWEYKTITVLPSPSAGTWDYTNGSGLMVTFTLATGSTFQTTAGAWNTGNFMGTSAQVNCLDSTANFFRVTGVKMELGPVATPLALIPFADELARCQRYYQKSFSYDMAPVQNIGHALGSTIESSTVGGSATTFLTTGRLTTEMRANPAVTLYSPLFASAEVSNASNGTTCSSTVVNSASTSHILIQCVTSPTTAVGHVLVINWAVSAEL